jgi:hypothetical protein
MTPTQFLLAFLLIAPPLRAAAGDAPQQTEFFEKKIHPVLAEQCYQCHSDEAAKKKKLRGGLRLDTAAGLATGGDSGPAVAKDKPSDSLLLKVLRYDGDIKMPPKGKLPHAVISDIETWLKMGAPQPRRGTAAKRQVGLSITEGRNFWAYQPIRKPNVPEVAGSQSQVAKPIDAFILAKLVPEQFTAADAADQAELVRRLYYDLIGLPPTPE